jgi:hypothetical protein
MINQIAPIPKTSYSPLGLNKGLMQARHIQAKLKARGDLAAKLESDFLWSPITASPYTVPITRWIE